MVRCVQVRHVHAAARFLFPVFSHTRAHTSYFTSTQLREGGFWICALNANKLGGMKRAWAGQLPHLAARNTPSSQS